MTKLAFQRVTVLRGDTTVVAFAYAGAQPTALKFYARKKVDGTALVALTLAANPTQFVIGANSITVTLTAANTDGQPVGKWLYDLEAVVSGATVTLYAGPFELIGDIATDAILSTPAAASYTMTAAEDAALGAASSPSAANPVITDSAANALIAAHPATAGGIKVPVSGNWGTPATAWADIATVTGWLRPSTSGTRQLTLALTDKATWWGTLVVGDAGGSAAWGAQAGTAPTTGAAYIVGAVFGTM